MPKLRFEAALTVATGSVTATQIQTPPDVSANLPKGVTRIAGTINGVKFRSAFFPTGKGTHYFVVNRELKQKTGLGPGDVATFEVEVDTKPRIVRLPPDLKKAVEANPRALEYWKRIPPSHKKAYLGYVTEAKRPETRAKRIAESVTMLARQKYWYKL